MTNQAAARAPQNFKPIVGEAATAPETCLNELFRAKITDGAIFPTSNGAAATRPD
jgi:hypothetical protein